MKKQIIKCVIILLFVTELRAQPESSEVIESVVGHSRDNVKSKSPRIYSPARALLFSAVLPGLGQAYNKKYWKIPLVYAGFGGLAYGINFYQKRYQEHRTHLFFNLENNLKDPNDFNPDIPLTTSQLRSYIEQYHRDRDLMLIITAAMYFLQMIDAHVDAHLKAFDLNPKLQVNIRPSIHQDPLLGSQRTLSFIFKL